MERPARTEDAAGGDLALQKYRKAAKFSSECARNPPSDRKEVKPKPSDISFAIFSIPGELNAPRHQKKEERTKKKKKKKNDRERIVRFDNIVQLR